LIATRPARGMGSRKGEGPREALRERGANEALRKLAVRPVLDKGMRPAEVAGLPGRGEDWAGTWVARYAEGGLAALRGLPRPGRPPLVPQHDAPAFLWGACHGRASPGPLLGAIEEGTGVRYHRSQMWGPGSPLGRRLSRRPDAELLAGLQNYYDLERRHRDLPPVAARTPVRVHHGPRVVHH